MSPEDLHIDETKQAATIDGIERLLSPFHCLHRYQLHGVDHIPTEGPALLVVNHSFATYDAFLMGMELYFRTGRMMRALGDDLIFKMPKIKEWAEHLGIVPASPTTGALLLKEGELLGVAPGGMREALRPSAERYRVRWKERKGFIRLAISAQVPIFLVTCPRGDDLYSIYESPLTRIGYKFFRVPIPIIRGFGPTILPRPVKLQHLIAAPLYPPLYVPRHKMDDDTDDLEEKRDAHFEQLVDRFHAQVITRMNTLMHEALSL
ncbi:MAG: acyltransferase family protein [Deltaproteobacteria bacterium]|nr:acyltransferase family protein [Deltaproteobacteria bacterium]